MFNYFNNFSRPVFDSSPEPVYDDILDKSQYSTDSRTVQDFMRSEINKGSCFSGLYDFQDGKIPDDPHLVPSDLEIQLREGKLQQSEIQTLLQSLGNELESVKTQAEKKKIEEQIKSVEEARQAYLDSLTGFEPDKESE